MLDERKCKYAVKTVAEEVIRANRREHVAMEKKLYGKIAAVYQYWPFVRLCGLDPPALSFLQL